MSDERRQPNFWIHARNLYLIDRILVATNDDEFIVAAEEAVSRAHAIGPFFGRNMLIDPQVFKSGQRSALMHRNSTYDEFVKARRRWLDRDH